MLSKEEIDRISLYDFKSESELLKEVQNLIEVFNLDRDRINDVYKSRKSVSAYLYYFFVTNIPRVSQAVERIGGDSFFQNHPIIEFGSGPGTLPLALRELKNEFYLVESSSLMQEAGRKVLKEYAPGVNYKYYSNYWDTPKLKDPILCFTNSFNELEAFYFWELIDQINPSKILFIEPGTKEVFHRILAIREELILKDIKVAYPCSAQTVCPLMGKDDWCHQYLKLSHHPSIERLTQKLNKDRRIVPLLLHVYQREESKAHQAILFSKPEVRKYGFDLLVCEENELKKYKVLKKRDSYNKKVVKQLMPGIQLNFDVIDGSDEIELRG